MRRWARRCGPLAALTSLVLATGCFTIRPPERCVVEPCTNLPPCCKEHVHIFLVNGMDPFNCANLAGMREYLIDLGFNNTSYGQLCHAGQFATEIRRIHHEDQEARFVLIGFSFGANSVRHLANQLSADGIAIELLVYLSGCTLRNIPEDQPANARRIINVQAFGESWTGIVLERAENLHVNDVPHYGSPSHPGVIEALTRELAVIASQVPIVEEVEKRELSDTAQAAQAAQAAGVLLPAEWDFLQPTQRLRPLPEANVVRK